MALNEAVRPITRPAAGDLSAALYKFMKVDSSGNATTCTVLGELAVGVLQNKPNAAGLAAELQIDGVAKVVAGATIAAGAKVSSKADGTAITSISTYHVQGVAMKGGVAGDIIEVLLGVAPILA